MLQGISVAQWESDGEVQVLFKMTVSRVAGINENDIASITVSSTAQTALRHRLLLTRYLSAATLYVTYSIYYTEDKSHGTPVYDEILGKLATSLNNGNFTTTLQKYAHSMNVAALYSVNSTSFGFNATKPEVVTNSESSDSSSVSTDVSLPLIAGIVGAIAVLCSGAFYYCYKLNKKKKRETFALEELHADFQSQDSGDVPMHSMPRSVDDSQSAPYATTSNPMFLGSNPMLASSDPRGVGRVSTVDVTGAAMSKSEERTEPQVSITRLITRLSYSQEETVPPPADGEVSWDIYGGGDGNRAVEPEVSVTTRLSSSVNASTNDDTTEFNRVVTAWKRRESNFATNFTTNPLARKK